MKKDLKIGFITTEDPFDRRSWSGTLHHLLAALSAIPVQITVIGNLRPQPELFVSQVFNFVSLRLFRKRYNYRDSIRLSKAYAGLVEKKLQGDHLDLLIAPAGLATIAHLDTSIPIIYINDRCLAGALDYHKILSDLFEFSREEGLVLEERTLAKASMVVYGSHWAAEAAKKHYPQHAHKIHVLPFGANLEQLPPPPETRDAPGDPLNMLFLGVKWEEKGGPIAYDAFQELKARGVKVKLIVCGCDPPEELQDPDLIREGFLNKNDPAQRQRLEAHLKAADLLIVPTRFEAYGIVFCEAAAYGVPVFATRTGGVPTVVEEGRTGYLFDLAEDGKAYAGKIQELIADPSKWKQMRSASRARFEDQLNWPAFTKKLMAQIEEAGLINRSR